MKELLEKIKPLLETFVEDSTAQFEKGNQAAGRRARKTTSELTKLFKTFRKESVNFKKED